MSAVPRACTPLDHWHRARGARFTDSDGWPLPAEYPGPAPADFGIVDLSAFAKLDLRGPGVARAAETLVGSALKPLDVHQFDAGGPALACRLTDEHLLLLAATTRGSSLTERIVALGSDPAVEVMDVTSGLAGFGLVGPRVEELLRRVTHLDLGAQLSEGRCAETKLAGVHALLVREARPAPPVVRVYVAWDLGEYVWETLLEAGRPFGLGAVGLDAWKLTERP